MAQEHFLEQTRAVFHRIERSLQLHEQFSDTFWKEMEEDLLTTDMGPQASRWLIQRLQQRTTDKQVHSIPLALRQELTHLLGKTLPLRRFEQSSVTIITVMGNHGSGTTMAAAKLAHIFRHEGYKVLIMARKVSQRNNIDSLQEQAEHIGIPLTLLNEDSDIATAVHNELQLAHAQGINILLIDTSDNQKSSRNSIRKKGIMIRSIQKGNPNVAHELLVAIDLTRIQAELPLIRKMVEQTGSNGVIITKVDKSTKAGGIFAIADDLRAPIMFLGLGEGIDQVVQFNCENFIEALFNEQ